MNASFAINLAWPETKCKQAGAWYDPLMNLLGFAKNNYYKVGHSAIILVDKQTTECLYFDFGRYHAPLGYGRVRDKETDHELAMSTKAQIIGNELMNFEEILKEIYANKSNHGDGHIQGSYCKIDFEKAFKKAKKMQQQGSIKYGPFVWRGTNCSRFVQTISVAGSRNVLTKALLIIQPTISPSPIWNVIVLKNRSIIGKQKNTTKLYNEWDTIYSFPKL